MAAGCFIGVGNGGVGGRDSSTDYVDMVDPYIMSARGRWFFFGTGKRPFGMVSVFPDTLNAGQGGGGYNYRFNEVLGFCHLHGWMTVGLDVMPTTGGDYKLNKGRMEIAVQPEHGSGSAWLP